MKKRISFYNKNLNILELNEKNKKNKLLKSQFKKTVNNCNIIQFSDYKKC